MTQANSSRAWTLHQGGKEYGPYGDDDIRQYVAEGKIDASSTIWCEGMEEFLPIERVFPYSPPAPDNHSVFSATRTPARQVSYAAIPMKQPRPTGIAAYRYRVGHRSFIFQIWLLVWTASYIAFLFFQAASITSRLAPPAGAGQSGSSTPSEFDPLAAFAGVSTAWVCLMVGWGWVGLPVGIAAVATMENNKWAG